LGVFVNTVENSLPFQINNASPAASFDRPDLCGPLILRDRGQFALALTGIARNRVSVFTDPLITDS
jgi:hypothetical protein